MERVAVTMADMDKDVAMDVKMLRGTRYETVVYHPAPNVVNAMRRVGLTSDKRRTFTVLSVGLPMMEIE